MICDKCYGCQAQENEKFKPKYSCKDFFDAYRANNVKFVQNIIKELKTAEKKPL